MSNNSLLMTADCLCSAPHDPSTDPNHRPDIHATSGPLRPQYSTDDASFYQPILSPAACLPQSTSEARPHPPFSSNPYRFSSRKHRLHRSQYIVPTNAATASIMPHNVASTSYIFPRMQGERTPPNHSTSNRIDDVLSNPYRRIRQYRESTRRRRQMWNLSIEKAIFSPHEICTVSAPARREVYTASLEAHINKLHGQLNALGYSIVPEQSLEEYHGLNTKLAKSMLSGLYYDESEIRLQLKEIYRSLDMVEETVSSRPLTEGAAIPNAQCADW